MGVAAILVLWPGQFIQTLIPLPKDAPHKIWLWLAERFLRRRCLKIVNDDDDNNNYDDNDECRSMGKLWAKNNKMQSPANGD